MATTGDLLGTAVSGLLASQRALSTISHNISNVNTPGYSRQQVELVTRSPTETGFGFIGNGVSVDSVQRVFDQFIIQQLRTNTSLNSQLQLFHGLSSQVDNLLADPFAGLSPALQGFFDSVQGVADDPASLPAREVMLSEAQSLASRFQFLDSRLQNLRTSANSQMTDAVTAINGLATNIGRLNQDIISSQGAGGPPNDLLDQRDEAIRQLSEYVSVTTAPDSGGAVNVFIGNGFSLVTGNQVSTLQTTPSAFDPADQGVSITNISGASIDITSKLSGGQVGGILSFRTDILEPSYNSLGQIAVSIANTFNEQHQLGQDLNGQLGGLFFDDITATSPQFFTHSANAGNATLNLDITDSSALTADNYTLGFNAGIYTLTNNTTNVATALPAFPGGTETVDGITVGIAAGAMVAGDRILIKPTQRASSIFGLQITSAEDIAAATPVRSSASLANTGDGAISGPVVNGPPPTNVNLLETITISFVNATTYDVNGVGTGNPVGVAYVDGSDIVFNGHTFQISGNPQAGDTFTIEANTAGVSDNRNALLLAGLQTQQTVNGSADYQTAYSQFVASVGSETNLADINRNAQQVLLNQSVEARESVSGVNLDEEAANLVKFQQAYQAAAQVITAANNIFQSLLSAVGR